MCARLAGLIHNAHHVDNKNQNEHFVLRSLNKPCEMKKPLKNPKPKTESIIGTHVQTDKIFIELDIAERTQKPPSEELIFRLNQLASTPPFSYRHKVRKNDPL
jgi:hypothetical protein